MKIMKRFLSVSASIVMALSCAVCVQAEGEDNKKFDELENKMFVEFMENDYLTMHYTVKDYQKFGIQKPELTAGNSDWESFEEEADRLQDCLDRLHKFDPDKLSERQRTDYYSIEHYLESLIGLDRLPGVSPYFEPGSGIHDNLLTNFTEFVFYEKEDIEDYLTVLATVPEYMEDAVDVTKRQAEAGYFMRDEALDETLEAIREFTAKKNDNELIIIFEEAMAAMNDLSPEEREEYCRRNREIVLNSFIPSYDRTADELEKLRGSRSFEGGMCNYENGGSEYYKYLVQLKTSSKDSIESQLDLCTDVLRDLIDEYITLVMTNPNAENAFDSETVKYKTPDEILGYLSTHLADFPESADVTYTYSYLDPSVANDSVVAYYVTPPVDDYRHNVVRINGDNVSDENDLYETLAHEGYPGHLYQNTWFLAQDPSPMRSAISQIGYSEGWAMYMEMVAWDISGLSEGARELHKIYTALSYIEDAAVDLGVNGLGWTVDDVADWLNSIGLNPASAEQLYDFVIDYEGLLLPYGVGMARFMTMRNIAEEQLGAKFNLKDFHSAMLKNGDRPFEEVQKDFSAYLGEGSGPLFEGEGPMTTPKPSQENEPVFTDPLLLLDTDFYIEPYMLYTTAGFGILALLMLFLRRRTIRKDPLA